MTIAYEGPTWGKEKEKRNKNKKEEEEESRADEFGNHSMKNWRRNERRTESGRGRQAKKRTVFLSRSPSFSVCLSR